MEMFNASIELSKIDKKKIYTSEKTGRKYLNLTITINDEPDQYGNQMSIRHSLTQQEQEAGAEKIYLGNGKRTFAKPPQPINRVTPDTGYPEDARAMNGQFIDNADDDLPF